MNVRTWYALIGISLSLSVAPAPVSAVDALEMRTSFSSVVSRVSPAVVNIYANKVVQTQGTPFGGDPFLQLFFGSQGIPGQVRQRVERSLGSGVIIRADGLMVTNYHVIKGATDMRIVFHDRTEKTAKLINADPKADIAILQLVLKPGETVPYLEFGDSDTLNVGDVVLAVGNPYGVGQSVSMGIVSALGRSNLGVSEAENFIQTDAAINPGNSGGALVDSNGKLMGLNTAIYTKNGGHMGIGFATPSNRVQNIVQSVIETGEVRRVWLGTSGQDLTAELANQLGLKSPNGYLINRVVDKSPAADAGLRVGDIILALEGREVIDGRSFNARLAEIPLGEMAKLKVFREGSTLTVPVAMKSLPPRDPKDRFVLESGRHPFVGYTVEQLSPALAYELGLPVEEEGVAIIAMPNALSNLLVSGGMRPGDIIVSVNRKEVRTINDLRRAVEVDSRTWEVVCKRQNQLYRVTITG